jgi:hypothetical protein
VGSILVFACSLGLRRGEVMAFEIDGDRVRDLFGDCNRDELVAVMRALSGMLDELPDDGSPLSSVPIRQCGACGGPR